MASLGSSASECLIRLQSKVLAQGAGVSSECLTEEGSTSAHFKLLAEVIWTKN